MSSVIELHRIINPSKMKINMNHILRFSPYRAVNTHSLGYKSNYLMLRKEIRGTALCSEMPTKHVSVICGQNVKYFIVKHSGT